MTEIERYARKYGRLHPVAVQRLNTAGFARLSPSWSAGRMRVSVKPAAWKGFKAPEGPVPCWVGLNTMYVAEGALNDTAPMHGVNLDLSTPEGFAQLAHECFHAYDCFRRGKARYLGLAIRTAFSSWQTKRVIWNHDPGNLIEQAATAFSDDVLVWASLHNDSLFVFRELR